MQDAPDIAANKALVARLYRDGFNKQDAQTAAAMYAEDAFNHGVRVGRIGMRKVFDALFVLFPDLVYTVQDCIGENDRVVCKVLMSATHLGVTQSKDVYGGMLAGVAATGKAIRVLQFHSFKVANGLIAEHAAVRDDLGMLQQLGIVAAPQRP